MTFTTVDENKLQPKDYIFKIDQKPYLSPSKFWTTVHLWFFRRLSMEIDPWQWQRRKILSSVRNSLKHWMEDLNIFGIFYNSFKWRYQLDLKFNFEMSLKAFLHNCSSWQICRAYHEDETIYFKDDHLSW